MINITRDHSSLIRPAGIYIRYEGEGKNVSATNRTLIFLDIIKGIVALIFGNIGLPPLVLCVIGFIQPSQRIPITNEKIGISIVCLVIAIYAYHTTESKIIKALVAILIFVPLILMLLSFFAVLKVPLPF